MRRPFSLFVSVKKSKFTSFIKAFFSYWTRRYQIKDVQQQQQNKFTWTEQFSPKYAAGYTQAVIIYFEASAWANTVSDRDWCKINTSQECDVLINSLCCSDRKARRVRGGLQRGPLWSCQVWPSKADEAVRLLIYLYWQPPSPPLKPSPRSASLKKICSASKTKAKGLDARSKAKYILKANSLPFATCFYCCRSPPLWRAFSWNLGWIGSSFQSAWQPGDPRELSADISPGSSMLRGQREPWLPGPAHSGATTSQSRRPKLKCEKLARLKAFLAPHGILLSPWQFLRDCFFFHVSFPPPFRLFNNMRTELSARDMLDRQSRRVF